MLILSHAGRELEIALDAMIIIKNATEKDYLRFANEDLKVEFDGESLYIHSPASKRHKNVVFNLLTILKRYLKEKPELGEAIGSKFALKLPNGKRPEPDVVVVPPNVTADEDSIYEGIPKMVIEILSPSTYDYDLIDKRKWYEENLIPEIWFIDLKEKSVLVESLESNGTYKEIKYRGNVIICKILDNIEINFEDIFLT
ncbi:MAG: Uma2 family endonuclease [Candidatus Helarchaeota archaeon]